MEYPVIISSAANLFYYSGLKSSNALLILYEGDKIIVTDGRYKEVAERTGISVALTSGKQDIYDVAIEILGPIGSDTVMYEDYDVMAKDYLKLSSKFKMLPVPEDFVLKRSIKTQEEVKKMSKASEIASKAFDKAMREIKAGVSEKYIAGLLEFHMKANGAEGVAFDTIVAFGANASMPHHEPDDTILKKGDCVLIDMGAKFEGYCSDMTRTFFYGKPKEEDKKIYDIVLKAQEAAIRGIKAGVSCQTVDSIARNYINENGYGDCFGHGLGHGVGIDIHEYPRLNQSSEAFLEAGMVVTVEPGIYLPGNMGVRIEDMVLVTEKGCVNLTSTDKKIKIK